VSEEGEADRTKAP